MRKPTILFYVIVVSIFLMPYSTQTAFSDAELPQWKVGYRWDYKGQEQNTTVNLTVKVIEITTIEMNGMAYDVYVVNITSIAMINQVQDQFQVIDQKNKYIQTSNLATVKEEISHIAPNRNINGNNTYTPLKKEYDFPILVGKKWTSSYTKNVSLEGLGTYLISESINYSVIAEESVTVAAGTFDCYKIEIDVGTGVIDQFWYSEKVKNIIKTTRFSEDIFYEMNLTAYSFKEEEDGDSDDITTEDLLPYILILIIVILIIVVIVARKRKKSKKKKKKKKKKKTIPDEDKKVEEKEEEKSE
ncbi:MAG: hypothetical protein JSW00_09760 [Thermoplasmata archaeon]|nr:MAG: hypothetical protein JSW00_09760 [Thermoplasmata archaeon]